MMKKILIIVLALSSLASFAQTMTIQCKNPDQGITQIKLKNDILHNIQQITHSKVKAEYWEVTKKTENSVTLTYLLEDVPASMYLDGKYQLTLSRKNTQGDYTASFYRQYNGETLTFSCRKL